MKKIELPSYDGRSFKIVSFTEGAARSVRQFYKDTGRRLRVIDGVNVRLYPSRIECAWIDFLRRIRER